MFNDSDFVGTWPLPNYIHFVGVATQVANAYLAVVPGLQVNDITVAIINAIQPPSPQTALLFRDALIRELDGDLNLNVTPQGALMVDLNPIPPAPGAPPPPMSPQKVADLRTIAAMRTPTSRVAGSKLADSAKRLEDRFHWTPRGESQVLPWEPPMSTARGKANFAIWLNSTGFEEPGFGTALNCWESVLFSAYKAHLITKGELAATYMQAEAGFRYHAEPDVKAAGRHGPGILTMAQRQRLMAGYNL